MATKGTWFESDVKQSFSNHSQLKKAYTKVHERYLVRIRRELIFLLSISAQKYAINSQVRKVLGSNLTESNLFIITLS